MNMLEAMCKEPSAQPRNTIQIHLLIAAMPSHLYRCGTRFQWTFSCICMALPARGICCCSRELLVKGGFLRSHFSPPRVPSEEIGLVLCRVDDSSEWIPRSNGQVLPVCLKDCHPHSLLPPRSPGPTARPLH